MYGGTDVRTRCTAANPYTYKPYRPYLRTSYIVDPNHPHTMEHSKPAIRALLTQGQLREAAQLTLDYADYVGAAEATNAMSVLSGTAEEHHRQWNSGLISYEEFSRAHARLAQGIADWLDRLPDYPAPGIARRRLLDEDRFKKRIFLLLCLTKSVVLVYLYYHWRQGGFTAEQFQATATLLAPAFAAYISVMLADYLRAHQEGPQPRRFVSGPLVTFSLWLFPIYALLILLFIIQKVKGVMSFAQMNFLLALVESVLGGYVGQIVFAFFKKDR